MLDLVIRAVPRLEDLDKLQVLCARNKLTRDVRMLAWHPARESTLQPWETSIAPRSGSLGNSCTKSEPRAVAQADSVVVPATDAATVAGSLTLKLRSILLGGDMDWGAERVVRVHRGGWRPARSKGRDRFSPRRSGASCTKAEDTAWSEKSHLLLRKIKRLFQHILDILQEVPAFASDYSHILRELLPNVEYCLRMDKRIYNREKKPM